MALSYTDLKKPTNPQVVDPSTGIMRPEWLLYFQGLTARVNGAVGELGTDPAPEDAVYIVGSASAGLSAERVATDTSTVDVDLGTAGQAKWNVLEVPAISSTGMVARTAAATYTARTITAPAAGITISNGDGVSGNPTLALANDLAALEALGSTGLAARTASDTWAQRTITGDNSISVTNGDGVSGNPTLATTIKRRSITDITAGDTVITTDRGQRVRVLAGTGTLAFQPLTTLGNGFWCIIQNAGTGDVTLDPDSAETIDGLTSWKLYLGGVILVQVTASDITSVLLHPMEVTFNASGTFTKPGVGTWIEGEVWGAGASGGRGTTNLAGGGGGGGGCTPFFLPPSSFGTTETITIGAGGAARSTNVAGANGGNTTIGSLVTGFGGVGGGVAATAFGGAGGGALSAGSTSTGGAPVSTTAGGTSNPGFGGGNGNTSGGAGGSAGYGGGGGGGGDAATGGSGGTALFGGGGGGGGGDTTAGGAAGSSRYGGAGGDGATGAATASNGTQPGGGGGGSETGNSGAGADGRVTIRIF